MARSVPAAARICFEGAVRATTDACVAAPAGAVTLEREPFCHCRLHHLFGRERHRLREPQGAAPFEKRTRSEEIDAALLEKRAPAGLVKKTGGLA